MSKSIDVQTLVKVFTGDGSSSLEPDLAYRDRCNKWVVMIWFHQTPGCDGTPWEGTIRVAVKHTAAKTPAQYDSGKYDLEITWDDLQAIKDHFWPGRIALEVYPPKESIVYNCSMRWLWVLPAGASLPFNLSGRSPRLLES